MKIAVIGLGTISPFFLDAIDRNPDLHLSAVCDLDASKLERWRDAGVSTYTDYRELLAADVAEGVVVTLPNDLHAAVACAALERGVAVCCEKPMAIEPAEAARMTETARRTGMVLFTAFHRRYNRHLEALAARLPADRRLIARVTHRYFENIEEHTGGDLWYLDPVRCGGGCVIDNGPNALDAVRHLLGDLRLVDATIGDVRSGTEFCAELDLVSADGVAVRIDLDWALTTGETKDIVVELVDGTVLTADLLAGYAGFKSSLDHEYDGILAAFAGEVNRGGAYDDPGPHLVDLVADAYRVARRKEKRLRMRARQDAVARMVKLLFHSRHDRGMRLSEWTTRCVSAGQIHELVTTTDQPPVAGGLVDRVGFLGFAEFTSATVVQRGDEVWLGDGADPGTDRLIGTVAGFDECHFPNHYNIVVDTSTLVTAGDIDLRIGHSISFREASA